MNKNNNPYLVWYRRASHTNQSLFTLRRNIMKKFLTFTSIFILFLILTACLPVSHAAAIPTNAPAATPQNEPAQSAVREAQVVSVDIQFPVAHPRQISAIIHGNLNDACSTLQSPQVSFESGTFHIELMVVSPTDRGCIQIITPYEQTIALDTANLTPGTYSVVANGISTTFKILEQVEQPLTSLQLVVRANDGTLQVSNLDIPLNPTARPTFNNFLPFGGSAEGNAYVLDNNQAKAVVIDMNGIHDLSFIERPTLYGLAVYTGSVDGQPRLAWGTEYTQSYQNSTLQISAADGSGLDTLLTQKVSDPLLQLVAEFWSADGQSLYFSKEPMGLGGYILFGGASNLYKINVTTREVVDVIPVGSSEEPQGCLDSISSDYRYVAEHCSQNFIRIRDLSSGVMANILPPEEISSGHQLVGSARFSPDGSRIAFAVAKGVQDDEQGWVVVSNTAISDSTVLLTSQEGSYYTVAGWLNDQTLLVQSTNLRDCSPYCASELWMVDINEANPQKVADGSFITIIPYGTIPSLLPTAVPVPTTTACKDAAQYIGDDKLDGTTYTPNTAFTKTWTVKNTGTCTWDSKYMVYQISGAYMTQQPGYWLVQDGQTVSPGQTVDISVGMTSPVENGNYRVYWGLKNEAGQIIPIEDGAEGDSFYVDINVNDGTADGEVTATSIDIVPEQGSGEACTADSTYFVHTSIETDGPTLVSYEIGSTAGQISAGYFEVDGEQSPYVRDTMKFDQAGTKMINLRFVGPYPYPDDITVVFRVNDGEWNSVKLYCP
jgi:hypothetical protein